MLWPNCAPLRNWSASRRLVPSEESGYRNVRERLGPSYGNAVPQEMDQGIERNRRISCMTRALWSV